MVGTLAVIFLSPPVFWLIDKFVEKTSSSGRAGVWFTEKGVPAYAFFVHVVVVFFLVYMFLALVDFP